MTLIFAVERRARLSYPFLSTKTGGVNAKPLHLLLFLPKFRKKFIKTRSKPPKTAQNRSTTLAQGRWSDSRAVATTGAPTLQR